MKKKQTLREQTYGCQQTGWGKDGLEGWGYQMPTIIQNG